MFTAILASYVAAELVVEAAICVVVYRNRKVLIPRLQKLARDFIGTTQIINATNSVTAYVQKQQFEDEEYEDQDPTVTRYARWQEACNEARRKHTKKPVFENFR